MKIGRLIAEPSFLLPLFLLFAKSPFSEALLFLGSVFLHEAGHLAALFYFNSPPKKMSLSCLGANIELHDPFLSYKKEATVFLAGPLAGIGACAVTLFFLRRRFTRIGMLFFFFNLILSLFNLLPIRGLDGGGILHALLCHYGDEETAKKICTSVHGLSLVLLCAAAFWIFLRAKNPSLLFLIGSALAVNGGKRKKATTNS